MNQDLTDSMKDLYRVQKEIDQLNLQKDILKKRISDKIKIHELEGRKFTVGDRKLCYSEKTTKQSLSNKYLLETLDQYFRGDRSKVDDLYRYIQHNRREAKKYQLDFTKIPKK